MTAHLLTQAERWLYDMNVEGVVCWLPGWEEVLDGAHRIVAIGNDGMAASLFMNTWADLGNTPDDTVDLMQLIWLGKALTQQRYAEMRSEMDCYG